jgi:acetylornithine deacetylase
MASVYDPFVPTRDASARAVDLLERLVAIPSVTGSEAAVVDFLAERYRAGWSVESIPVSSGRRNILIHRESPRVVLTTHADTVPDHFPPRREGHTLYARGACDAKGSLAAMAAALELLGEDSGDVGLLVLVGEERGSDGALAANRAAPPGVEFVIGGEPTGNRFVLGSKGCLRIEAQARGEAGHSSMARPGTSAIHQMLDFLSGLRGTPFASHPVLGETTMNIGTLHGGSAPNVTAESARAEILFRTGEPVAKVLARVKVAAEGRVDYSVPYLSDPIFFRVPRGVPSQIVAFACDLPLLSAWGEPLLLGPGAIEDAHSLSERVALEDVEEAVRIYADVVRGLLAHGQDHLEPRNTP